MNTFGFPWRRGQFCASNCEMISLNMSIVWWSLSMMYPQVPWAMTTNTKHPPVTFCLRWRILFLMPWKWSNNLCNYKYQYHINEQIYLIEDITKGSELTGRYDHEYQIGCCDVGHSQGTWRHNGELPSSVLFIYLFIYLFIKCIHEESMWHMNVSVSKMFDFPTAPFGLMTKHVTFHSGWQQDFAVR